MKKQLEKFVAAVQAEDAAAFVEAVEDYVSQEEGKDLEELFQSASRKDIVTVCEGLVKQVKIGAVLIESEPVADEEGNIDASEQQAGSEILSAASIVCRIIFAETRAAPPPQLLEAATLLHDHCLLAANDYPALQEHVARLCLDWWQAEGPEKDRLTPQTMPYLLVAAIQTGTAAAVKRCHAMRTSLELFNFDDPSIGDVKRLLLRAAFAPSFLRCTEGRRFLAFLFTLQPAFVKELTAIIKNQIPAGRKSVLDAYGEIIYRAWTLATGACLLEVQLTCIQELMEAAILASTPAMASALRRVLAGLHSQKHQPGVDRMLLELYEPILFRRLNAPNAVVRRNALELFVAAFPLRDPDESNEATDARMNEQFAVLTRALKDDVPAVRAVAVTGTCHILNTYWELIPGAVITGYLKLIAADLAFDGAAPAVRAAVAAGLATMVDNPLAQPLLKLLLPKLEPMLYDASAKVRMAFADLLLSLRGLRALKWYDIVDVHKLLDVMTSDTPAVSERIQRLLLPSYFPDAETGPAMVAALLRASPEAGRAFCLYLAGAHMPGTGGVGAATPVSAGPAVAEHCLVALVKDLTAHLLTVPLATAAELAAAAKGGKKGRNKRKKARGDDEGEDPAQARDDAVVETQETWEAILGGLAAVCCGLGALIAAGKAEPGVVRSLFAGGELATLLGRCKAATARADIASVAAALPTTVGSSEIRAYFASQLVAAGPMSDATELKAGVDCLCASPAARNLLVRSIASAFGAVPTEVCPLSGEEEEAARKGNRGKKKQDIAELLALEGLTQASAIEHLGIMLEMEAPRSFLITSGTLGRMLPWVEAAAEGRVAELAAAVAAAAVPDELGGRAEAAGAAVVYMRGGLHLILAAQPGLTEEPLLAGTEGDAAKGQGLECMQQATEWATRLLHPLIDEADADALVAALNPPAAPKPSKRSKVSGKGKHAAEPSIALTPGTALKASYIASQACIALAAEAARLGVLAWSGAAAAVADAAARCAQLSLTIVRRCLAAPACSEGHADFSAMAVAAVSQASRLARALAFNAGATAPAAGGARDLGSELAQAASTWDSPVGPASATGGGAVAPLAEDLLQTVCEDRTGACAAGVKPHLAGLLTALTSEKSAAREKVWVGPLASFVARSIDESAAMLGSAMEAVDQDENAPADGNMPQSADQGAQKAVLIGPSAALLSDSLDAAAVKQFVQAAKLVKASEVLAGQAAAVAEEAWLRGDAAGALGAVELAQALGFTGVTVRGKSRAGGDSYAAAISKLRVVQSALESEEGDAAHATGPKALLRSKMLALFPPPPRVTFEGAMV